MHKEKHKLYMFKVLTDIAKDKDISGAVGFKGGTALMFFHGLPRFSVDLDFKILDVSKKELVYSKVRDIALQYG